MATKKILVVHGYAINPNGSLSPFAKAICRKVEMVAWEYDTILFIGGWHLGPETIGTAMRKALTGRANPDKLYTAFRLGLTNHAPPRDSMEEIDFVPAILQALGCKISQPFDAICIWSFMPRLALTYRNRDANAKIIPVFCLQDFNPIHLLKQFAGLIMTLLDPKGKKYFKGHRKQRTFGDMDKLITNTPENWKK